MKLPNGQIAVVDISKLKDYCLSTFHLRGRHKARVFLSALGLTSNDAGELRAALLQAAQSEDARRGASDEFGVRYIIDFDLSRGLARASIRSSWILRNGEVAPRFVSCYVL